MSDKPLGAEPTRAAGGLQFDRAEREGQAGLVCAACKQGIGAAYYEVNGNVTCQRCRNQIVAEWNRGTPGARFAKALGLGAVAAALGAGLYFGIEALTGYELGLVAIVVGLMVGGAVRKGSNGRGGWRYQALAIFLTYSALVATDSSMIAREFSKQFRARGDSIRTAGDTTAPATAAASTDLHPDTTVARTRESEARRGQGQGGGPLVVIVALVALLVFAYAAPIMIGISSPLHLVIAGFALYEAWKLNKAAVLRVTGPYQAGATGGPGAAGAARPPA